MEYLMEWQQKLKIAYFSWCYTQALYGSDGIQLERMVQCYAARSEFTRYHVEGFWVLKRLAR